ncbi:hypothetical protein [Paraburkholderia phosphatilytica]|uniref:hypothetical protein n=1 Tax=Paraburkholderia phosphatilytica TaxID=2282883 RepID=UPI001F0BA4BF|nr:hypothetical protein [Paraburkholderia phosphatilytica]
MQSVLLDSGEWECCPDALFRERFAGDPFKWVHPVIFGIDGDRSNPGAHELAADSVLGNMQAELTSLTVDVFRDLKDRPPGFCDQEMVLDDFVDEFDEVL